MSEFTEPTQPPMSVKKEIKEEEFDDFLQEYLSTYKTVEEKHEMDCETYSGCEYLTYGIIYVISVCCIQRTESVCNNFSEAL